MKKYTKYILILLLTTAVFYAIPSICASADVRVKDIAHVLEARENQLMGFGLVAGLKNTGDTTQTEFTKRALTNLLSRMGIAPQDKDFKSRNVAAVMVIAKLPAFINSGQNIDVIVSSMGDATSLQGGTLLMTPLQGADDNTYAVAQGQLSFGFANSNGIVSQNRQFTTGRVINGAIVEREVPVSIGEDSVSIVLDRPDFTTSSRVVDAMSKAGISARARDAATIIASKEAGRDMVEFVTQIENLTVVPDSVARIVIDEQNGVIVMGQDVKISAVAVSYGNMTVTVLSSSKEATLFDLVKALNAIGVRPKDLVSVLQSIKSAGAISADIEVM
jgi:flagellar P-ring protein precursor FlgI